MEISIFMETSFLKNLNIQELNSQEMKETNGGIAPLLIYGAIFAAGIVIGYLATRKQ